ncbi:MAG: DUF86 domain-containing protein [Proteobacteria bacterium]|nr:DUF86 domain-containing protein [Pseudomonadota bacterium]NIS70308.1 DUF86 domain-containing protein [Pseudomonadota bacterium]
MGYPQDYSEVIRLMGENGVFEGDLAKRLVEMVKFRNMLVHLYWKIEDDRVHGSRKTLMISRHSYRPSGPILKIAEVH